jgi:hypothetical protein
MASDNETIADIIAVMRHDAELCYDIWLNDPNNNSQSDSICKILNSYADRIEAAWKRERKSLLTKQGENVNSGSAVYTGENKGGNAAAMREALELLNQLFDSCVLCTHSDMTADEMDNVDELYFKTKSALAAPPRNCDLYNSGDADKDANSAWDCFNGALNLDIQNLSERELAMLKEFMSAFVWLFSSAKEGANGEQK